MKRIAVVLAGLATALIPLFASASPVNAGIHPNVSALQCEVSSPNLCMFSNGGTQITEPNGTGTPMNWHPNGGTFLYQGQVYNIGTINEPSVSPACIGTASNGTRLTNQNCNTGTGIIWAEGFSGNDTVWLNRKAIQDGGNNAEW